MGPVPMSETTEVRLPSVPSQVPLAPVELSDRFDLSKTSVMLNGAQAVARLLIAQKERDRRAGYNTGGFVSGYRGSPVGGLDLQFTRLAKLFKSNDIHFEPGLNEELAATAIWGSQQAEMRGQIVNAQPGSKGIRLLAGKQLNQMLKISEGIVNRGGRKVKHLLAFTYVIKLPIARADASFIGIGQPAVAEVVGFVNDDDIGLFL